MPIAAPIRWSLVGDGSPGFAENIVARHPLTGLRREARAAKGNESWTINAARPPALARASAATRKSVRARVEALERVMERLFRIPGTNRKVGLDVILDLVPFAGQTAGGGARRLSGVGSAQPRHVEDGDGADGAAISASTGCSG